MQPEYEEENEFFRVRVRNYEAPHDPESQSRLTARRWNSTRSIFPTYLRLVPSLSSLRSLDAFRTLSEEESKLRYVHDMDFRTPIDDTHTMEYRLCFVPSTTRVSPGEGPPFESSPLKDEAGNYRLDFIPAQDALAWESQGALADRTREHIGLADRGVIMLRKLIRE